MFIASATWFSRTVSDDTLDVLPSLSVSPFMDVKSKVMQANVICHQMVFPGEEKSSITRREDIEESECRPRGRRLSSKK